jgi:hypothetical protein
MTGRSKLVRKLSTAVFFGIAALLVVLAACFTMSFRAAAREATSLESRRDELQAIADRLEERRGQAEIDQRIVMNLLALCRSAEDIPDLRGNRVAAQQQGLEKVCFYAPAGTHTLVVSYKWKPQPTSTEKAADANTGEQSWSVPLLPESGYFLTLTSDRKGGPVGWELTGNHPRFETRAETALIKGFSQRGSSWSGSGLLLFPNQIERFTASELDAKRADPPGLRLLSGKLNGVCQEQSVEIAIEVHLKSSEPACISASEAQRIIVLGRDTLLEPYTGGGKYTLRSD